MQNVIGQWKESYNIVNGDKIRLVDKLDKQTKFVANDSLGSDETRWYLIHTCTSLTSSTPRTAAWHSEWTYIGNNITCRKKIDVVAVIVVFIHMNRILEMWNCRKSTERKTYACENDVRMTTARDWAEVLFRCCAYFRHDCVGLRAKYVCLCIYRWAREFKFDLYAEKAHNCFSSNIAFGFFYWLVYLH